MKEPLSYWLFKLRLEFHYVDTFGKDDKIRKQYEEYLKDFYEKTNKQIRRNEKNDTRLK